MMICSYRPRAPLSPYLGHRPRNGLSWSSTHLRGHDRGRRWSSSSTRQATGVPNEWCSYARRRIRFQTVKIRGPLIALMVLVFLLPACSGKSSVLTAGYERFGGKTPSPNAERAKAQAAMTERAWEHEIQSRARRYPEKRFSNPSKDRLMGDLRALAQKHDFELVSARLPMSRQVAPKIVVRTKHYLDLAQAT